MDQLNIDNSNALILLKAAKNLGLQTKIISEKPFSIKFIYHDKSHIISKKSMGINTSLKAKALARDKYLTTQTLRLAGLHTPRNAIVSNPLNYQDTSIPFPQVIKPLTGEKGKDIYLNIKDKKTGQKAINQILEKYPKGALVETYHQGNDYRFICLNFKLIGLSQRTPPQITGNGQDTIRQLIEAENQRRFQSNQKTGKRMLNRMRHWPRLAFNLKQQDLSLDSILTQGKTINLYKIPNFSTGGLVKTVEINSINPDLVKLAEEVSKTIDLEICGIDILIKNLTKARQDNATIIEVNSDPGLRLHDWPNLGKPQHVAEKILKNIFNL